MIHADLHNIHYLSQWHFPKCQVWQGGAQQAVRHDSLPASFGQLLFPVSLSQAIHQIVPARRAFHEDLSRPFQPLYFARQNRNLIVVVRSV